MPTAQADANSLGPEPNTPAFNAELRSIYIDFLHRIKFKNSAEACAPVNRHQIGAAVTALCGSYISAGMIRSSSGLPALLWKDRALEQQVKFAHFTSLGIAIDDLAKSLTGEAKHKFLEDLSLFQIKMSDPQGYATVYPSRGDLHPALEGMIQHLRCEQNPFYPAYPRTQSMIVKSVLDFIEGTLIEQYYEAQPMKYVPEMRLFSNFLRVKTGLGEAYSSLVVLPETSGTGMADDRFYYHTLYPLIPELNDSICCINDLLSFYKEAQDGETDTTIVINAQVKKQSQLDAIREMVEFLVGQRNRIMAILDQSGSEEWKKKIQMYYQGYISWHLGNSRYRLKQLLGDWYQGEFWS